MWVLGTQGPPPMSTLAHRNICVSATPRTQVCPISTAFQASLKPVSISHLLWEFQVQPPLNRNLLFGVGPQNTAESEHGSPQGHRCHEQVTTWGTSVPAAKGCCLRGLGALPVERLLTVNTFARQQPPVLLYTDEGQLSPTFVLSLQLWPEDPCGPTPTSVPSCLCFWLFSLFSNNP